MSTDMSKILPNATQYTQTNKLLAQLCVNTGGTRKINNWSDIQAIVRAGLAPNYFHIGDQLKSARASSITATCTGAITNVSVNWDKFLGQLTTEEIAASTTSATKTFVFTHNGSAWTYGDTIINQGVWGLTYTGTPVSGNTITVSVTAAQIVWDILGFDYDTPVDTDMVHSMTLGCQKIFTYGTLAFDAQEFMYSAYDAILPAGTYHFTLNKAAYSSGTAYDGTYQFTTTVAIPIGGGFRHTNNIGSWKSSYAKTDVLGNYITTFAADRTTALESGLTVTEGSGGTDLGSFTASNPSYRDQSHLNTNNFTERQAYGNNRWKVSAERQYLNGNLPTGAWWSAQDQFDRQTGATMNGFLYGLEPQFKNVIGQVTKRTAKSIADGYGYEDLIEYMWLLSRSEIYDSLENSINERGDGTQTDRYPYWQLSATGTAADNMKIKYEGSTARYWWMRSPVSSNACYTRTVSADGSLNNGNAFGAGGVVPACVIV